MDPVFENNVILTETERLTMNSRPKAPKYARNKNVIVIGGSGSGKTRFYVKPNLMQMTDHVSYPIKRQCWRSSPHGRALRTLSISRTMALVVLALTVPDFWQ